MITLLLCENVRSLFFNIVTIKNNEKYENIKLFGFFSFISKIITKIKKQPSRRAFSGSKFRKTATFKNWNKISGGNVVHGREKTALKIYYFNNYQKYYRNEIFHETLSFIIIIIIIDVIAHILSVQKTGRSWSVSLFPCDNK